MFAFNCDQSRKGNHSRKTQFKGANMIIPVMKTKPNRHDRRHLDELPEWMTKRQVAEWLQCSERQVELLTAKGRISKPVYLGESSPRWKRSELISHLDAQQDEGVQCESSV